MMHCNNRNGSRAALARVGFAVLLAALGLTAAGGSASAAPTETVLHSFTCRSDGANPQAGLIADISGNLYGTTVTGGASGIGVVFKLSPGGTETVLHAFTGSDGIFPQAGLISDSSGNLYGTTANGDLPGCGQLGCGVVFKFSPSCWTETVLHAFSGGSDGAGPVAGLISDSSGNLYGTASGGGALGDGVVFKLSPGGTETVLHAFSGGSDGANPHAGLIADSKGNLYGTTLGGGPGCEFGTCGVLFKLSPGGTETVLYSFCRKTSCSDGAEPFAGLIADSEGNLYGTTAYGGAFDAGVVFKLSPGGTETVLHSFAGGSDGALPFAGLIADSAGNLYGTTFVGGAPGGCGGNGCGVVFKLSPGGTETVLYSFTGGSDGAGPQAGLIADSSGNLYGTTVNGGASGNGVVFRLTGTGFGVPVLAFNGKRAIPFGGAPNQGVFALQSSFTLSSTAPVINPATQAVKLQAGNFTKTIPAGSFKKQEDGSFTFVGVIGGARLKALIKPTGTLRYAFHADVRDASLTGTTNPGPVTLSIGDACAAPIVGTASSGTANFR